MSAAGPPSTEAVSGVNARPSTPLLRVAGLRYRYRSDRTAPDILREVSFSVSAGETVCLLGENGTGKSTLLRLCAGLLPALAGEISLCQTSFGGGAALSRREIARQVAYLPQDCSHVFAFSAREVVLMGCYARSRGAFESPSDLAAAEQAMAATDVLRLADRLFNQLSGGEQRRVLLAQALAQDTALILLDEPTAGLDPAHSLAFAGALAAAAQRGKALLFATHDLNLALRAAPRALLLADQTLRLDGPTAEILTQAGPFLGVSLHLGQLPNGQPFVVPM